MLAFPACLVRHVCGGCSRDGDVPEDQGHHQSAADPKTDATRDHEATLAVVELPTAIWLEGRSGKHFSIVCLKFLSAGELGIGMMESSRILVLAPRLLLRAYAEMQ